MPKVVSNSSVLIHLNIFIPEAVYDECVVEGEEQEDAKLIKSAEWIKVERVKNDKLVKLLYSEIDKGEAEAIVLALEIGADLILLDDYEARQKARLYDLKITGTLGILLRAKFEGKVSRRSIKQSFFNFKTPLVCNE
jgi:predicted nucleic acid-binding protein